MGCKSSRVVTPNFYEQEAKDFIQTHRRKSQCSTQSASLICDDSSAQSYTRGKRKNSLGSNSNFPIGKTINNDTSMDWERLETIESEKTFIESEKSLIEPKSSKAYNVKVKKYKSPYALEDLGDEYDINDASDVASDVAVQPDSWYPKPRPKLFIEIPQYDDEEDI